MPTTPTCARRTSGCWRPTAAPRPPSWSGSTWLYLALRGHALEGISWLERLDGVLLDGRARRGALVASAGLRYVTGDIARMSADADAAVSAG